MNKLPLNLSKSLQKRKQEGTFRSLGKNGDLVDLCSNDYLGFSFSKHLYNRSDEILREQKHVRNGATGSRLLSGNHPLYPMAENKLRKFHGSEAALIFNSGYDANIGFFSTLPQKRDLVLFDELIHASIRDGIGMSKAKAYKFKHNDLEDLSGKLLKVQATCEGEIYIVTESVFSMDGDSPDLNDLIRILDKFNALLVIDEAHALGVFGDKGAGLLQEAGLQDQVFARIITFGKALGAHGAAVLGSQELKDYLVNFSRSFIYTTALPPHSVASVLAAYECLESTENFSSGEGFSEEVRKLRQNIQFFINEISKTDLQSFFIRSNSAIHSCIVPGNKRVKELANRLRSGGFEVKPILSPTVPVGKERLRFCLHSYNSEEEISEVLWLLNTFVK